MAPKKKNILVATIGTRDLAFQVSSGEWFNVGEYQSKDRVLIDLNLDKSVSHRELCELLLSCEEYQERLVPIILGKLIADEAKNLSHIYLIATDQLEGVKQRMSDTLYAAEIISRWIATKYAVPTTVFLQGSEGLNPSSFEQMFTWWQKIWEQIETQTPVFQMLIMAPKGGVGSSTEAARVSALSRFEQRVRFCDFTEDPAQNRIGNPSPYTVPTKGLNYLWDRKRKESIELLDRYDYEAVKRLLKSYLPEPQFAEVRSALDAAVCWNQGNFVGFAQAPGAMAEGRSNQWWWIGYEVAYLAMIRLNQSHTAEAMFHSFRSVEGTLKEYLLHSYPHHVVKEKKSVKVKQSICRVSGLEKYANKSNETPRFQRYPLILYSDNLTDLIHLARPDCTKNSDLQSYFGSTKNNRNVLFHGLEGLERKEVFENWGCDNLEGWENRVLGCLNFMTGEKFDRLQQASLMSAVHQVIVDGIANYRSEG